jgi:hypothetical protein
MSLRAKVCGIRRLRDYLKATIKHFPCLGLTLFREPGRKFMVHPRSLGLPTGLNYDNLEELVESLESSDHK